MGQGKSRDRTAYVAPELPPQPIRKTGSLTSLTFGKMGRKSSTNTIKRSRSFKEIKEVQEQQLREKLEAEARELDKWVNEKSKRCREYPVPRLKDLAGVAVARTLEAPLDVERLPVSREIKQAVEFRLSPTFDLSIADPKVVATNGGRTIQYTGKGYSTSIMKTPFNSGLQHGRHAWIVHIDTSRVQGWIQIGVVDHERVKEKCVTPWDGNPHPFRRGEMARRNNGNFHSGRSELEATMVQETIFLGGFGQGDTIAIKVDFDAREMQWLKNGAEYGGKVFFEPGALYPSVSLDSPGEAVTMAYYTGTVVL